MTQPMTSTETEHDRFLRELEDPSTKHEWRRDIGDRLNEIGDPRPGTGVIKADVNGRNLALPALAWCDIPAPPSGKVWLGADDQKNNSRREVEINYSFKVAGRLVQF